METETNTKKSNIITRPLGVTKSFIARKPFFSFLVTLGLLIALIGIANTLSKPKVEEKKEEKVAKEVSIYTIGTSPKIQTQATVKKSGTISIYAQSAGIVQKIYKNQGDAVSKGTNLLWLSTTYNGSTLSTIQKQQAQANYEFNKNNLSLNKEIIAKQKQLAEESRNNTEELKKITEESIDETRGVVETSDQVLRSIVQNIETLEASPSSAANTAQINQLKGQQAQLQGSINQLRNANRNAEYQTDSDNSPTKLADYQKDLTIKQLDLQDRSLTLQLEVSKLGYQLAQISESLNYPASPITGKVERINVSIGETVNPGQLLAVVTTDESSAIAESFVTTEIAQKISTTENAVLHIGKNTIEVTPGYVSSQPTNGQLHNVTFEIPEDQIKNVTNGGYLKVEIPVGTADTTASTPFIPVDSIYQTQDGAFIYVAERQGENHIAKGKKVEIGQIIGKYVEVTNGLLTSDMVITDRTILEGDQVKIKQ